MAAKVVAMPTGGERLLPGDSLVVYAARGGVDAVFERRDDDLA